MYSMKRTSAPTRSAELDQVDELVVVVAAHHDRVELERAEARAPSGVDAGEHGWRARRASCQPLETIAPQRVEADRDAMEPGALERRRAASASSTPFVVSARSRSQGLRREQPDQRRQVAAQQRLAAGRGAAGRRRARANRSDRAGDLLEVEDVLAGQPEVLLLRHAVVAAQVAAVGDREPEAPQRSARACRVTDMSTGLWHL